MPRLGDLPLARRDVERLRQIIALQRRLHDVSASLKARRALTRRNIFRDALTWLDVHGRSPDVVAHWKALLAQPSTESPSGDGAAGRGLDGEPAPFKRRRRRRRRRVRPAPTEQ
jgi:hypothetical protein